MEVVAREDGVLRVKPQAALWVQARFQKCILDGGRIFVMQLGADLRIVTSGEGWRVCSDIRSFCQPCISAMLSYDTFMMASSGDDVAVETHGTHQQIRETFWKIPGAATHPEARSVEDVAEAVVATMQLSSLLAPIQRLRLSQEQTMPAFLLFENVVSLGHTTNTEPPHLINVWACFHGEREDMYISTFECITYEKKGKKWPFPRRRVMFRCPVGFLLAFVDQFAALYVPQQATCSTTKLQAVLTISPRGSVWLQHEASDLSIAAVCATCLIEHVL